MHWSEPFPGHCLQYNTREYSALLWDIPPSFDVRKGCEYTPIDINGETVESPDVCDDQGEHGMYGHWRVNFSEMACKPLWGSFSDLGCTGLGTGKHRVESRLWNLRQGDDWAKMCGTTPALIHNVDYPSPTYCDNRGIFSGMYGIWDIEDPACI
ncbi:hypothetical protein BD410DRAFT_9643 [Rickenella mellea]|uniref:Uncharacterized protein n=1 Tax=Rickenella mellea TaxID=50990 RepID=A0A4V3AZI2_9AGAM|nr:hypothetical protein BD410DRAFT_9643 [Rickenella mellea]